MLKNRRIILWSSLVILIILGLLVVLFSFVSNSWNAKIVAEIPSPAGFTRAPGNSYTEFLRSLPLKKRGSLVHLHDGKLARLQFLSAGVIDMPVLSRDEQCADVAMRLRAEYLWQNGRYGDIVFTSVGGKKQPYSGGSSRKAFEKYMRTVYGTCNTASVFRETKVRPLKDIQPGDVLVYPSRHKGVYGHAVLVADVARSKSGKIAVLCVEGNTPAREAHVIRNLNPFRNPWFVLSEKADSYQISFFRFNKNELRHY